MSRKKTSKFTLATADCETDPFRMDRVPSPFVWGFYTPERTPASAGSSNQSPCGTASGGYQHFWGAGTTREQQRTSCIEQFINFLESLADPHLIYMHNGGKFDFIFLLQYASGSIRIVNGRILEMSIGKHKLRDSYAAIPIPLGAYKKDDIDYAKLELHRRQKCKAEILHYLGGDVQYLFEMVASFRDEFGDVLTIGSAAMRALKDHYQFDELDYTTDAFFRRFYYGGRNQCFSSGIIRSDWKVFDVNSMYPDCMRRMQHPISYHYTTHRTLDHQTDFLTVEGINHGGLPFKDPKLGTLSFTETSGTFAVTGHELRAALDTGTFELQRIIEAYTFEQRTSFENFVDHWFAKRLDQKKLSSQFETLGDIASMKHHKLKADFYKLILNSGYGKLALNSDNFRDWEVTEPYEILDVDVWNLTHELAEVWLWSRPTAQVRFFNVATGASITGAARGQLLRGLAAARNPVYCDTDSIICEDLAGEDITIDPAQLGAWKLEATGNVLCIAGKKLYALFDDAGEVIRDPNGKPKQASKGTRMTAQQIRAAAAGDLVTFQNPVPAFKLSGDHQFITRHIRATTHDVRPFGPAPAPADYATPASL